VAHNVSKTGFPEIPLTAGMKIRLEARSTTADAAVAGVTVSLWAIYGWQTTAQDVKPVPPPYSLDLSAGTV
jgi:hypothetical protein